MRASWLKIKPSGFHTLRARPWGKSKILFNISFPIVKSCTYNWAADNLASLKKRKTKKQSQSGSTASAEYNRVM